MPAGNISAVERQQRFIKIKDLQDEGLKDTEIAEKLGMALTTVKRNLVMLKELSNSDLTPEIMGKKRAEYELGLQHKLQLAMEQFEEWKDEKPALARSYLLLATEIYMKMAKIFGLDANKFEAFTQINQLNQYDKPDRIEKEVGDKIADAMKRKHEG